MVSKSNSISLAVTYTTSRSQRIGTVVYVGMGLDHPPYPISTSTTGKGLYRVSLGSCAATNQITTCYKGLQVNVIKSSTIYIYSKFLC